MSLAAILKPADFFQRCQLRATLCQTDEESCAFYALEKTKDITEAQFDKTEKQHPNILTRGDNFEKTTISLIVRSDHPDLLKRIVQKSKKTLEIGSYFSGKTPLFYAVHCKEYSTIKELIELGANVNTISYKRNDTRYGTTVLEHCVSQLTQSSHIDLTVAPRALKLLLSRGACIQNPTTMPPFMQSYLVEQCQEFSDDIQRMCKKAQQMMEWLKNLFPNVLGLLIMDYAITDDEDPAYDYIKRHNNDYNQPIWFNPPTALSSSLIA